MSAVNNPTTPYWGKIPEKIQPGLRIKIDGHIPSFFGKFAINLVVGQGEESRIKHHASNQRTIALHLNSKSSQRSAGSGVD